MNVYDSHQIESRLAPMGYSLTQDLACADVIIVNTCTIRAKAEQKAFSFLGRLAPLKERNPELIIGIGGCVAQQQGKAIFKRMPYVDLVFGTQAIARLPESIKRIADTRRRVLDIELDEAVKPGEFILPDYVEKDISAFVTIMRGCDNYCSYCIVPFVRGREASRPVRDIIDEIRKLVANGIREVTLLGQNVNSFGLKEGIESFVYLLEKINDIDGLYRIRFTTSHPKDLSDDLIDVFVRLEKLCHHIHLPVQSGSNAVLSRMNRRYSVENYLSLVSKLRHACPDIAISSDIIVGFPGETDGEFSETLALIQQVQFDSLFAFVYSDRPHAPAVHFRNKIAEVVKKERLQAVLDSQKDITAQKNQTLIGHIEKILVDGPSKQQFQGGHDVDTMLEATLFQWSGRTSTNKIVHFEVESGGSPVTQALTGRVMDIKIKRVLPHCLWGKPVQQPDDART